MTKILKKLKKKVEGEGPDEMGMYMQNDTEQPKVPKNFEGMLPKDIDLVSSRMKMKQLKDAIGKVTEKLISSKPVVPWKYTGPKDTVEEAFQVNHVPGFVKKVKKVDSDEEDSIDSADKKKNKDRTKLFERDYSEIRKLPWKFKFDEKEMASEEEEEPHDDFGGIGNLGGGKKMEKKGKGKKEKRGRDEDDEPSEVTPDDTIVGDFNF